MSKEIYISSTPHETRLAIVENDDLTEIYYERENEYTLAGSIYNGKVTRVLPGMQSSFVDIGLERDAFLYITDFLEEAGDSADFEGGEGRRSEGGRGDGRRGDVRQRSEALPAGDAEGAEAEAQEPRAVEGGREQGSGREGSGDRSRDRDRGRRQRGGGRDGRSGRPAGESIARPEMTAPLAAQPVEPEEAFGEAQIAATMPMAPMDATELGEGAPAAEGSRRWRGRRGRRRGRGPNREGQPEMAASTGLAASDEELAADPDLSAGYDLAEMDEAPSYDAPEAQAVLDSLEASAAPEAAVDVAGVPGDVPADEEDGGYVGDRHPSRAGARERGEARGESTDRGRRGGGREGGRSRGAGRESSYGDGYGQAEAAQDAPATPILLPGESLAKYRAGGAPEEPIARQSAAPASAPEFRLPGAWDGGTVLPGETLRPRPAGAAEVTRSDERPRGARDERGGREDRGGRGDRQREDRGGRDERGRDRGRDDRGGRERGATGGERGRDGRGSRPEANLRSPQGSQVGARPGPAIAMHRAEVEVVTIPTLHTETGSGGAPVEYSNDGPAVVTPAEAIKQVQEMAPGITESSPMAQPAPVAEHTAPAAPKAEYEPTEGAASYRVDPAPPREFRQPAEPVVEPPAAFDTQSSTVHLITPAAGERLTPIHDSSDGAAERARQAEPAMHEHGEVSQHAAGLGGELSTHEPVDFAGSEGFEVTGGHDVTAIGGDGVMLSAMPAAPPAAEVDAPSAPIEHETAVVEEAAARHGSEAETPAFAVARGDDAGSSARSGVAYEDAEEHGHESFAGEEQEEPGDEEDFHTTTIHAAAIEEMEYDDDETVETTADLGGLIRDMSIDQLTRTSEGVTDSDDDEFAFEEEDSVGDEEFAEDSTQPGQSAPMFAAMQDEEMDGVAGAESGFGATESTRAGVAEEGRVGQQRTGRRDGRDGRRGGRDRGRSSGGERGSSDRSGGDRSGAERSSGERSSGERSSGERSSGSGFRAGRREGHRSAQTTNLPAISDLLKPGQELLVQIAKEPIAKKGARITSHIALPGRFLVFMPTVNHTGVSRKIESDGERRRLKEILLSEKGEASGGFIVRTAASGASEEELRSDLRFLLNLWADIKQRSEGSKSPALIYHDLNLVERILRDQVTDNFSAIWVDNETDYERILRFLQRFQPSLIRRVKLYTKETPLFEQFGISEEINKALRSKVWLKSGGSIVINQTEALVAIDINTGKYVGKTARLEDTIVKTNLDAIPEIVRQIRLRDLGGIIIIDFIDMDERKNRNRVMAALEDELKKDRAPSKVLQFNDFGLVAITRKRVKQSLERTLSTPCNTCTGTGMVKSPVTVCNDIYVEMRKMQKHLDRGDVMLRVNPEVVKQLKSPTARWLQEIEEMVGKTVLVKSDPTLHPEQFDIH